MNTAANQFVIRRAEEADIPRLADFYQRFHPNRPRLHNMQTWRWEFLHNPNAGEDVPFFVIEAAGAVHGGIGYLPVRLQVDDHVMQACHPVNHFVDPEFKGLPALRLMRACLRDRPVAFISYVSDDGARLAKAIGFVDLSPHLTDYYFPLRSGDKGPGTGGWPGRVKALALRGVRKALVAGARVYGSVAGGRGDISVSAELPPLDHLLANVAKQGGHYRVVKDQHYFFWRYSRSPILNCVYVTIREGDVITAVAVVHLEPKQNQAVILDILQSTPRLPQLLRLLVAVIDHCRNAGATALFLTIISLNINTALRLLGFGHTQSDYRFMVYAEDKALKQKLADHRKWEFFLGDTDVY